MVNCKWSMKMDAGQCAHVVFVKAGVVWFSCCEAAATTLGLRAGQT